MSRNRLAAFAIALWLATIAAAAWVFVRGSTAPGTDGRTAIVLAASEKDFVMSEMRQLLATTQTILDGTLRDDRASIVGAARPVGMGASAHAPPTILAKLPLEFKKLAMSMHHDMDGLADAAEAGKPMPELQRMLSDVMLKCVQCHATWQFREAR